MLLDVEALECDRSMVLVDGDSLPAAGMVALKTAFTDDASRNYTYPFTRTPTIKSLRTVDDGKHSSITLFSASCVSSVISDSFGRCFA